MSGRSRRDATTNDQTAGPPGRERSDLERAAVLRVLLAHDLSPAAERAAALIAGTTWPRGTVVRVVSSPIGIGFGLSSFATLSEARVHGRRVQATIAVAHDRVATGLRDAGVSVETEIVHGRPERALITDALRYDADLIVVGARDQGPVAATLLGSVSRAVVETAPCSVLVARGSAVSRVLLATDGSAPARLATTIVASWPMFAGVRTKVVGVGAEPPGYAGLVLGEAERRGAFAHSIADSEARSSVDVDAAVQELASSRREVEREIRLGDPGKEIVTAARWWAADLVAIGAYGQPFLRRLILGSVARKVVDGISSSVLVARPRPTAD